jgi:hypothetical protein
MLNVKNMHCNPVSMRVAGHKFLVKTNPNFGDLK